MKKAKFLLLTLLAILGFGKAAAANGTVVTPYSVDFNTAISTGVHNFSVATGWDHIVGSGNYDGYGPYYMSYSYNSGDGIDGTGTLIAYSQYAGDSGGGNVVKDVLVTPILEGTVTLYVKKNSLASTSYPSWVEFYAVNEAGNTLGELLQKFNEEDYVASADFENWNTITLTLASPTRVGIRAQQVYLDNLTATKATILDVPKLAFKSVTKTADQGSTAYFNQQEDGSVLARFLVTLQNTGTVDLIANTTENYTLSLKATSPYGSTALFQLDGAFNIPVDISAGATSEAFEVEISVPADKVALLPSNGFANWYLIEDISGNTASPLYAGLVKYESKFIFDKAGTSYYSSSSATTKPIDFGMVNGATTLNYEIYNPGSAPLTINSFTIDAPFTSTAPAGEFTVAAGEKKAIDITFPATEPGIYTGKVTINYTNFGKEQATYTLDVSATVIDPSKNLITFSNADNTNGQFPAGSIHSNEVYISQETKDDVANYYLMTTSNVTKFITPLLTAEAGELFTYDTWYTGNNGGNSAVTVYTSKDRVNWEQVDKQTFSSGIGSTPKTFTVTIPEAGDYYLAFELTYPAVLDNIYGLTPAPAPAHDWYVMDSNLPTTAKQNNPYTATIDVQNISADADVIETATLYVNGEAVAVQENVALKGNEKTAAEGTGRPVGDGTYSNIKDPVQISLTYNPHTTGELPAYIELKSGDKVVLTEEVIINIAEEVALAEAGTPVKGTVSNSPLNLNYCNSETVSLYTGEILGLNEGAQIQSITYRAYCTNSKAVETNLSVYYEWTDDQTQPAYTDAAMYDTSNMTPIIENQLRIWEQTAESGSEMVDYIVLDLSEPIVYEQGKSLRIVVRSINPGDNTSNYKTVTFEKADITGGYQCYGAQSDGDKTLKVTHYGRDLPAIHLGLLVEEKTFNGIVIDDLSGQPIEGATVTLYNEEKDVEYTGTTDEQGAFTINVIQDNLSYTATIEADGYLTLVSNDTYVFENSIEQNFALTPNIPIVGSTKVTISDSEYATLYYEGQTLTIPEDVKAYTAKVDGKNIILNEVKNIIPAGTPVIINGPQGEYLFPIGAPVTTETALFDANETYGNGAEIGTENVTVVLGNDRTTKNYEVKTTGVKNYCANLFGVTDTKQITYVVGGNNPKGGELDDDDKSTGTTYNKDNKVLPKSGCYYMITPETNGHFTAFIVLNNNKPLFVAKGSDGSCLLDSKGKPLYTVMKDGDEPTVVELAEDFTSAEKINGTVEFDVVAGETYYIFCTGSKLSFGGYVFSEVVVPDNDLIGTENDLTITDDADYKYYLLSWKDANKNKDELGFYFWKNSTDGHSMQLGAHKAYLKRPANAASNKGYVFWLPDAIEGITMEALTNADAIYTLSGIRVNANNLKKGIYIVNGKKVVIK